MKCGDEWREIKTRNDAQCQVCFCFPSQRPLEAVTCSTHSATLISLVPGCKQHVQSLIRFSGKILLKVSDYVSKMVLKHFFLTVMLQTPNIYLRDSFKDFSGEHGFGGQRLVEANAHSRRRAGLYSPTKWSRACDNLTARSNRGHVTEYTDVHWVFSFQTSVNEPNC